MKVGINIKLDVTKIDKSRIFQGQKGKYVDLTTFVDIENPNQYGDNGFVTQSQTKEERSSGSQMPIIGNAKVFYKSESQQTAPYQAQVPPPPFPVQNQSDDDIAF